MALQPITSDFDDDAIRFPPRGQPCGLVFKISHTVERWCCWNSSAVAPAALQREGTES